MMQRFLYLVLLLAAPVGAQTARLDDRLPDTTSFYLYWRGSASVNAVRDTNALLRLWADPEFAPAREAVLQWVERQRTEMQLPAGVTSETIFSLLENPLIFGSLTPLDTAPEKVEVNKAGEKRGREDNFFLIYEASGKQALVESLIQRGRSDPKGAEKFTRIKIRQFDVDAVKGAKSTHYQTLAGNFFLVADSKEALEDLLARYVLHDSTGPDMHRLADFQQARRAIGDQAALEMFLNLGDLIQSAMAQQKGAGTEAVKAVGFNRLRLLASSISFERVAARFHLAVLADMSPGSIFDLFGEGGTSFAAASVAPADTASFNVVRIDFPAIYRLVMKIASGMRPAGQNPTSAMDAVAKQAFGMTAEELLNLPTGEVASFGASVGLDPLGNVFAFGIRKPDDVLHVLRVAMQKEIQSEDVEGGTTILSVTSPFPDTKSGTTRRKFLYVGVTPNFVLVAPRKAMLKNLVAQMSKPGGAVPAGLAADAKFNAARARLPQSLTGIGYADFSRVNWEELAKEVDTGLKAAPPAKEATPGKNVDWKSLFKSTLISKYLHLAVTGWWKDSDGLHFDGFIE